jgi:NAD(P)-dependent dehydrogenase (short-subunit alcohol dehydrogenase family)
MSGTVVVTGASTGIGRATALRLARGDFTVLAGVRRQEDADALHAAEARIEPVIVDVTDAAAVAALRERLAGAPLAGLVNNAGIAIAGPLEGIPLDELRRQYEVNVFGLVAVTQALLEPLRAGRGRIVNVGSIGGRIATPFVAPYSSSKAAVRSLSTSLRRELRPWGIRVALVEPGALDTPIWAKGEAGAEETIGTLSERVRTLYAKQLDALRAAQDRVGGRLARARRRRDRARAHRGEAAHALHRRARGPHPGRAQRRAARSRLRRARGARDGDLARRLPVAEGGQQLVLRLRGDRLRRELAEDHEHLAHLLHVERARVTARDVRVEARAVGVAQCALEVVGHELDELLATEPGLAAAAEDSVDQIRHLRSSPRALRAPWSARGAGAPVDWSRRCPKRYAPPPKIGRRRRAS